LLHFQSGFFPVYVVKCLVAPVSEKRRDFLSELLVSAPVFISEQNPNTVSSLPVSKLTLADSVDKVIILSQCGGGREA